MEKFIHAFNLVSGGGYVFLEKIRRFFGDWRYAWEKAGQGDFLKAGLTPEMAGRIVRMRGTIDVNAETDRLWSADIFTVPKESAEYPMLLREIDWAPYLLYRKGSPLRQDTVCTAVVGTRMPSAYGERFAQEISEAIAGNGGTVVSGLAYGIDAIAHYGAVKKGKPTVGVLASSLERITPSGNAGLARKILETGGSIISEYTAESPSWKGRFLERNRIISGLCKATIVIEAKSRSGALITAKHALKQNREIYALVGDLARPQAQGCLDLIGKGEALPITSVRGLLCDLGFDPDSAALKDLGKEDLELLEALKEKTMAADELCRKLSASPESLNVRLTRLEMKNLVRKNLLHKWEAVRA